MLRLWLQIHKWIALAVGLQVLAWFVGGLVMTAIPINIVRGENHIPNQDAPAIDVEGLPPLSTILQENGAIAEVGEATLKYTPHGPIWVLKSVMGSEAYYDAKSGGEITELTEDEARAAAIRTYSGTGHPIRVTYLDEAPEEADVSAPLYQVEFDDWERSTLYLDTFTGEALSRRSNIWRFYDFFWRIHVMDWQTGNNFNNPGIIAITALSLPLVITGFVLLWITLVSDWKVWRSRARAKKKLAS